MKIFKNTELPKKSKYCKDYSIEVIICDWDSTLHVGTYDYEAESWVCDDDYYALYSTEDGNLTDFVWMYKPEELKV